MTGLLRLALSVAVVTATATRTPIGTLAVAGLAAWRDQPVPDLLADFRPELAPSVSEALARALADGPEPDRAGPLRPAQRAAIRATLGAAELPALEAAVAGGASLEQALERRALSPELLARVVARATAAGERSPGSLAAHRRFLPDADARRADAEVHAVLALATALELGWPVPDDARITSAFGWRTHPVLGDRRLHEGLDIAVPTGTPVWATGGGAVSRAAEDPVSGRHVILDHGHGVSTAYCHASALHVVRGDTVGPGEVILASGATGRATGPHLHYGVRIDGRPVDPVSLRGAGEEAVDVGGTGPSPPAG